MNIASIDIGSNTVLLLIAEQTSAKEFNSVANYYRMPRIGRGLSTGGYISDESINKLFEVLEEYSKIISEYKCKDTILTGTAALRKAENSDEIINEIRKKYGWDVNIVNGKEEARLSFLGATGNMAYKESRVVIDIGGGSTEIIYGNGGKLFFSESIPIGAVNLTEKHISKYPAAKKDLLAINKTLESNFSYLKYYIPKNSLTVAVAGTPISLTCINKGLKEYEESKVEGSELTRAEINNVIKKLKPLTPEEVLNNFGAVVEGRNDVILTGALIIKYISDVLGLNKIIVSGRGIRYGAVVDYLLKN